VCRARAMNSMERGPVSDEKEIGAGAGSTWSPPGQWSSFSFYAGKENGLVRIDPMR
jgi:hypothetical protein